MFSLIFNAILDFFKNFFTKQESIETAMQEPVIEEFETMYVPWMQLVSVDLDQDWKERSEGDNPAILAAFEVCGYNGMTDEVPWCGVYVGSRLKACGFKPPEQCAWARNYSDPNWGTELKEPEYGCIANVERGGPGGSSHVGFIVAFNDNFIRLAGGNQSNSVTDDLLVKRSKVITYKLPPKKD